MPYDAEKEAVYLRMRKCQLRNQAYRLMEKAEEMRRHSLEDDQQGFSSDNIPKAGSAAAKREAAYLMIRADNLRDEANRLFLKLLGE